MFSNWFSGDARERYCASSHKQRIDQVGNSLVELHCAEEVLRQHLHEWLRFSAYLDERGLLLAAVNADTTRPYLAERTSGKSASRSRVLRASVRIFLETDEQGQFRRRMAHHRLLRLGLPRFWRRICSL
jgi:hypothetical protein